MKIARVLVKNFRSYENTSLEGLGSINLFVGPNNAGKSTLLKALHLLQQGHGVSRKEIRIGEALLEVKVAADDFDNFVVLRVKADRAEISISLKYEMHLNQDKWQRGLLAKSSNHSRGNSFTVSIAMRLLLRGAFSHRWLGRYAAS